MSTVHSNCYFIALNDSFNMNTVESLKNWFNWLFVRDQSPANIRLILKSMRKRQRRRERRGQVTFPFESYPVHSGFSVLSTYYIINHL